MSHGGLNGCACATCAMMRPPGTAPLPPVFRERATTLAALIRRGSMLRPLKSDAGWLVELLEHALGEAFAAGGAPVIGPPGGDDKGA